MKDRGQLRDFLSRNPLPWLWYDEVKDKFIMVVDNTLMSTYRACPQHFIYAHVQGLRRKGIGEAQRIWNLEFGALLHKMFEVYYKNFRNSDFNTDKFCTERAVNEWHGMKMDEFAEHKEYKLIGGVYGFSGLLLQYVNVFAPVNEKLRVLGTEVPFGKNLEIPLYIGEDFELYLAGRMDMIIDDGYFICPLDHKTMGDFRGEPSLKFEADEGPTGYIYALKSVLPQFVPEDQILKRDCSKILMNLISKKPTTDPTERFRRIQIRKTSWQLEQYQHRMIDTGLSLLESMDRVANSLPVYRNTNACQNWWMRECTYFDIDRQQSHEGELVTISNGYIETPLWDTEAVEVNS